MKLAIRFAGAIGLMAAWLPVAAEDRGDALHALHLRVARRLGLLMPPPAVAAPSLLQTRADATGTSSLLALTQAVHLAVGRHPSIADAVATLAQHEGGVDVARAGYYPQIRVGVDSSRGNGMPNARSGSLVTASASQMLYDFGRVSGTVAQSEAFVQRQQALVLKQIDTIAHQAAQAVVQVHRYQVLLGIAQAQVRAVEKVLETARLRANAGISTQSDPIQAESRVDSARANQLLVRAQHAQWRERLHTLLGEAPPPQIAPLPDRLATALRIDLAPDDAVLPDVLAALAERRAATAQLDVARAQRYPTLSLDASAQKAIQGANPGMQERGGLQHTLSLNLSSVLYQGGAQDAQIRAALAAEEAASQRIEAARLHAGDQARSFREQILGAQARLGALAARKRTIAIARDLYREQYTLGTRSILDLLNAEQEIYQAAAEEEAVQHDLWDSRIAYIDATGQSRAFYGLNHIAVQGMDVRP